MQFNYFYQFLNEQNKINKFKVIMHYLFIKNHNYLQKK